MKNNYKRCNIVVLIPLLYSFFFLGKMNASPFYYHFTYKPKLFVQQQITGIVRDQKGVPIPGVNVIVAGSSIGTMTNLDGEYTITTSVGDTLLYSYIGFKAFKVQVTETFSGDITLQASIDALEEVVINAGYYNTTKRERTGNIVKVSAAEIENQPLVNPLQALQGRMAGVEITPTVGIPGASSTIQIRGTNSLREEGNRPLYIVDGIPINSAPIDGVSLIGQYGGGADPLNTIGLYNIKSIEVLKDADATAIYGSRGANGVILITTKKETTAKSQLEAHFYTGASSLPNRMEMLNTQEYLKVRKAAFENDGVEPTNSNAYDLLVWDQNKYTDWQEYFLGGTAPVTNASLQYSGGSSQTGFRLGGSYFNQGTIYPTDFKYEKVTGNLNLNHRSNDDKLQLNLAVNYGIDRNDLVGATSLLSFPFSIPPNAPSVLNRDGSLNWDDWLAVGQNNPLSGYFNNTTSRVNNFIANLSISYRLQEGLNFKTSMGYTNLQSREIQKMPSYSYNPNYNRAHQSTHTNVNRTSWILEPQLLYEKNLLGGTVNAILGTTFQKNTGTSEQLTGVGYVSDVLIGNLAAAESVTGNSYLDTEYKYNAVFGRLGFKWQDKYYLNLTGRRDGSSRFGPGKRFANFGAVGAAWIFSEEKFIKDEISWWSFGKFRGSYGTTGNDQIGDYGYLDAYEVTTGPSGLYPTQLFNPNYSWETNKKLELAIELGFLKDRINLAVNWYRNRSSNQLVGLSLPAMTGFNSVQANLPASVENKGWEIELNTRNIQSKGFNWQTSFNISFPKNKLIAFPDLENSSYQNTYQIGKPLNIRWLYEYDGIDPETGYYAIADINGDGRYDYNDRIESKALVREYYGGINNSITYKNFSLDFLWQFVKQEGTLLFMDAGRIGNQRQEALETLNADSPYQMASQSIFGLIAYANVQNSPFFYTDASFLRLKTLSLNYEIPKSILEFLAVQQANLFIHGQNLITITPYKGLDPESPQTGNSYGGLRTLTAGIQLNF
ncbi:SusC/RagA family TonB-linked outer membrane protein [Zunongwangia endophytica]|uniref:SusC/RagA family TonB-linked outer membrane protein n=1 Tax=Zunongwangia endophytica TaxID=1808945 RepID=A0ABV8HCF4_9FLAO|nr:SusC/RagA family TonB-linked outer membrane protein [Zunongwangia endophytica]MDN3594393.1 SusC/RagA family TonB-linked outer membrane protein [Zunongwangia endophytica]